MSIAADKNYLHRQGLMKFHQTAAAIQLPRLQPVQAAQAILLDDAVNRALLLQPSLSGQQKIIAAF